MFNMIRKNPVTHLVRTTWANAAGRKKTIVIYSLLACIAMLIELARPLVLAELMNAAQKLSGQELLDKAIVISALYFGLSILFWMVHGPSRIMEINTSFLVKRKLQSGLFRMATLLPMRWHLENHSGETIDQNDKATQALGEFAEGGFEVIRILTQFIGATVMLTWVMPAAGLTVTVSAVVAITVVVLFDRVLIKRYEQLNKRFNQVAASIQDYLTNVGTVISLRLEDRVSEEVEERIDRIYPLWKSATWLGELKWMTAGLMVNFTRSAVILGYIAYVVYNDLILEVGTLYALVQYLTHVAESFFHFTWKYGDLVVKSTRVHATDHIVESFEQEVGDTVEASLPNDWKQVDISGLTFQHNDSKERDVSVLHNIDLTLKRGRSYGVVGESGSGKSTLLGLLRGIHLADNVEISCDGEPLKHGLAHFAHRSTLIPQEPEIFSDTIRFNVTMGIDDADQSTDVMQAIDLARFTEVLKQLPAGLATDIAEKGVNLSGGQKQRLALARGLYFAQESGSDILLMDEPTSSVDKRNETLIYQSILGHFGERTILAAVHNLDLLSLFDEVLVFASGELVEHGGVSELLRSNGELSRLWHKSH